MNFMKKANFNAAAAAVAGNPQVVGLARERAAALQYEMPQSSNRQKHAAVPNHPEVTRFFRRDEFTSLGLNVIKCFKYQ